MAKKLIMGNEAIALGAIKAGVNLVAGYPGTPSTEVLETIARQNPGDIYVEWSVNEKVALEVAAGAAYTGARALVTMKQVGLNVASDPLMSLAYIGVKGALVLVVADDPGPISSQTEQDTRHFAKFANLPVFDPTTPEEAYDMIGDAFAVSERFKTPVIFRPTTRICHSCARVDVTEGRQRQAGEGFVRDSKWVVFPRLSYLNHIRIEALQQEIADYFSSYKRNVLTGGGRLGVAASGVAYAYACEALRSLNREVRLLKLTTANPFPERLACEFLRGLDEVLVLEELDPVMEENLIMLCGKRQLPVKISGKLTGALPYAGEYSYELVEQALCDYLHIPAAAAAQAELPSLPARPPVLCAGCPHRASFYAVKTAMKGREAIFTGDIGCYTLGNAQPLDMVDTCLCMGAGITVAQGLKRSEPQKKLFAFIGDSTFFHTGLPGVVNAVYNQTDITVIILDNSTTAMTGHQPHPGTGKTAAGEVAGRVDIAAVLQACGVGYLRTLDPFDFERAVAAVKEAADYAGVSAIIFKAPCIALFKPEKAYAVQDNCINCGKCIREIGCPAISANNGRIAIEAALCYGCGLCAQICPTQAIGGGSK